MAERSTAPRWAQALGLTTRRQAETWLAREQGFRTMEELQAHNRAVIAANPTVEKDVGGESKQVPTKGELAEFRRLIIEQGGMSQFSANPYFGNNKALFFGFDLAKKIRNVDRVPYRYPGK